MINKLEKILNEVEREPRFKLKNPKDYKMYMYHIRRWDRVIKYKYPKK